MKRLIDWFVDNRVAANLLMLFVIAGGSLTLLGVKQEIFPEANPDIITVSVIHPGATPEEIEEGICIKVEEAVEGLEGVKRIRSTSSENVGIVSVELYEYADKGEVLDDVKARVDTISTFPEEAEKPVVLEVELSKKVLDIIVHGKTDALTLKRIAREIRDDLAALSAISQVNLTNAKPYEISIEVSEDQLRRYGLSFDEVVRVVRQSSLNLAGGTVKARDGEILLRTDSQAYVGEEFEEILLLNPADGTRVTLGDVAQVIDEFEDLDLWSTLNGEPALTIGVDRVGEQSAPTVAAAAFEYFDGKKDDLPEGVSLTIANDWSKHLKDRRELLLRNGFFGLILIFVLLAMFLRFRLAFWVALGIPTALMGAIWLLPSTDVTINMLSLFAFITVLGILVDDAIVVGENIFHHSRKGLRGKQAAKTGTYEVMVPVVLAILTTIAAFVPMLTLPGWMGKFARVIPIVVICALIFSLVESLLILPHHLSHLKPPKPVGKRRGINRAWAAATGCFSNALDWWIEHVYKPSLAFAMRWRYATFACGVAVVILAAGLFKGGFVKFTFFPPVEGDQIIISLVMPEGTPAERTHEAVGRIERALAEVRPIYEKPGEKVFKHSLVTIGAQPLTALANINNPSESPSAANRAEMFIELYPSEIRGDVKAATIMREIRTRAGEIPGARELKYNVDLNHQGAPVSIQFRSSDLTSLRGAAAAMKERLAEYDGTYDITDDLVDGKREIQLFVTPEAEALGITQAELARQVRQGFYGDEAQRIQRGRDDVKVMVRYPKGERRSLADLENMRIRLPGGGEVPFLAVARAEEGRGAAAINRADGERTVTVSAEVDGAVANANEIVKDMKKKHLPGLEAAYPNVAFSFEGEQREQSDTLLGLMKGAVLASLLIYTLLALAFSSFVQPLIVLLAIPFGMVGAVLGHMLFGMDLTMLSAIGLLAMAGVVVNDSMIMIDFTNRRRREGRSAWEAIKESGPRRFRPILLTSLTTFAGLMPLLLETSVQAQFLIPMAISLSFGVLFSTFIILLVVPSAYLILHDIERQLRGARAAGLKAARAQAGD